MQVTNVSPSISGLVASPINENDMTTLTGTINDPGALDRFTVAIDWGNGTLTFNNVARGPFSFTRQYLDDDPTGTPVDHVPISLAITDDDTGLVTAGTSVRVSNVAPTVVNLSATAINEGGTTTLTGTISDPGGLDTFALTVDWGNGTQSFNNVPAGSFSFTRQYRDDAPSGSANDRMPISVTAVDDDGGVSTSNTTVLVRNIAPAISSISSSAAAISAASGEPVTILGSFTDPGSLDSHTVQVDWGDGSVSNGAVTGNSGAGTFRATHTYAAGGVFTATLTLRDDDTGAASRSSTALVTGIAINKRVLQIVATTGNDQVKVKRREDIVHVKTRFAPPAMFNYADFARIEVFLLEGDDKARIDNSIDKRVKLEGGSGHDKLKGGSGDDTLRGGPGNDQLNGKAGNDLIEGGAGADKLTGQRGSDVLLGGAGDDRLRGRHGADLMAGDAGADRLKGGREGDILIGGSANLNSNALRTILDEWRSTKDLTVRVTNIRNSGGLNGTAVLASDKLGRDGEPDLLKGSGSIDWLFADTDILRGRAFTGDPAEAKTRMVDLLTSVG